MLYFLHKDNLQLEHKISSHIFAKTFHFESKICTCISHSQFFLAHLDERVCVCVCRRRLAIYHRQTKTSRNNNNHKIMKRWGKNLYSMNYFAQFYNNNSWGRSGGGGRGRRSRDWKIDENDVDKVNEYRVVTDGSNKRNHRMNGWVDRSAAPLREKHKG